MQSQVKTDSWNFKEYIPELGATSKIEILNKQPWFLHASLAYPQYCELNPCV